jgi:hypothetical protein
MVVNVVLLFECECVANRESIMSRQNTQMNELTMFGLAILVCAEHLLQLFVIHGFTHVCNVLRTCKQEEQEEQDGETYNAITTTLRIQRVCNGYRQQFGASDRA